MYASFIAPSCSRAIGSPSGHRCDGPVSQRCTWPGIGSWSSFVINRFHSRSGCRGHDATSAVTGPGYTVPIASDGLRVSSRGSAAISVGPAAATLSMRASAGVRRRGPGCRPTGFGSVSAARARLSMPSRHVRLVWGRRPTHGCASGSSGWKGRWSAAASFVTRHGGSRRWRTIDLGGFSIGALGRRRLKPRSRHSGGLPLVDVPSHIAPRPRGPAGQASQHSGRTRLIDVANGAPGNTPAIRWALWKGSASGWHPGGAA